MSGEIGAYAVYDIPSLPAWHRGAICLIGDAAHAIGPHVGQGASLALEYAGYRPSVCETSSIPRWHSRPSSV